MKSLLCTHYRKYNALCSNGNAGRYELQFDMIFNVDVIIKIICARGHTLLISILYPGMCNYYNIMCVCVCVFDIVKYASEFGGPVQCTT